MTEFSSTEERIAFYLKLMEKAMPEIRRQIKVYEEAIKSGKRRKKQDRNYPQYLNPFYG